MFRSRGFFDLQGGTLQRATIYTTEISKQVTKGHVRMQFTVYLVN
jgi:hypothetical protein